MEKLEAKSIINDKLWLIRKNNKKVGSINNNGSELEVTISGKVIGKFKDIAALKRSKMFRVIEMPKKTNKSENKIYGYKCDTKPYNATWDVKQKLPLYTKSPDSKSWFAAGYYRVAINRKWTTHFCPKLILLERNDFQGPFKEDPTLEQYEKLFK